MFGAIIGDFVGSTYEFSPIYSKYFNLFQTNYTFTDDSVLTAAITEALMYQQDVTQTLVKWTLKHKHAGYGKIYFEWALDKAKNPALVTPPGTSWGNGCLMRNSPVILLSPNLDTAMSRAQTQTNITHSHPESLQAVEQYARITFNTLMFAKEQLKNNSQIFSNHPLKTEDELIQERKMFFFDQVRQEQLIFDKVDAYCMTGFHVDAKSTLPRVLSLLWESADFEDVMKNAVFIGGDCDTNAAIAGSAAEIIYGIKESTMKNFLAYAQCAGLSACEILPMIASSYLRSPHKNYFFEQNPYYLGVIEKLLAQARIDIANFDALNAQESN